MSAGALLLLQSGAAMQTAARTPRRVLLGLASGLPPRAGGGRRMWLWALGAVVRAPACVTPANRLSADALLWHAGCTATPPASCAQALELL